MWGWGISSTMCETASYAVNPNEDWRRPRICGKYSLDLYVRWAKRVKPKHTQAIPPFHLQDVAKKSAFPFRLQAHVSKGRKQRTQSH